DLLPLRGELAAARRHDAVAFLLRFGLHLREDLLALVLRVLTDPRRLQPGIRELGVVLLERLLGLRLRLFRAGDTALDLLGTLVHHPAVGRQGELPEEEADD